jgi:hypothetical protein
MNKLVEQYKYQNLNYLDYEIIYNDKILYVHKGLANSISTYFDIEKCYKINYDSDIYLIKIIFDFYYFYDIKNIDDFIRYIKEFKNNKLINQLFLFCKQYGFIEFLIIIEKYIEQRADSLEKYYFCNIYKINSDYKSIYNILKNTLKYICNKNITPIFNEYDINQICNYTYDKIFINILKRTQNLYYNIPNNFCDIDKINNNKYTITFDKEYIENNSIKLKNSNCYKEYKLNIDNIIFTFKYEYYHDYHKGNHYYEFEAESKKKLLYYDKNIANEKLNYYPNNKLYNLEYYYFIIEK